MCVAKYTNREQLLDDVPRQAMQWNIFETTTTCTSYPNHAFGPDLSTACFALALHLDVECPMECVVRPAGSLFLVPKVNTPV
jgi:hypothetical protein